MDAERKSDGSIVPARPSNEDAAEASAEIEFTAVLHHVDRLALHSAFLQLKKIAAVGFDGVTWHEFEQNVEDNIADLHRLIPGVPDELSGRPREPPPVGTRVMFVIRVVDYAAAGSVVHHDLVGAVVGRRTSHLHREPPAAASASTRAIAGRRLS